MADDLVPRSVQEKVATIIFVAISLFAIAVLILWVWIVLSLAGVVPQRGLSNSQAMMAFGVSLALVCAAIWVPRQVGLIRLSDTADKRIWRTLIVGLLAAVVVYAKSVFG